VSNFVFAFFSEFLRFNYHYHYLKTDGNVGAHWLGERVLSISLLALLPIGIYSPNIITDQALAVLIPIHAYIGVTSSIIDYFPKHHHPMKNTISYGVLRLATLGAIYGFYVLNTKDIGIGKTIQGLWKIK